MNGDTEKNNVDILQNISMVCANYGNAKNIKKVLEDWFLFLGGKPGEVIISDAGSDKETRDVCMDLLEKGQIDTLIINKNGHPESGKDFAYIREYHVANLARKKYILFFKFDTLPFREGNENWLVEAIRSLDEDGVFAYGGAFNYKAKHHTSKDGYYFSERLSENFALIKRDVHTKAVREFAPDFIDSNFTEYNPFDSDHRRRFFVEVAWEEYIQKHDIYTLVQEESVVWTIFHTNLSDEKLEQAREMYFKRGVDVEKKLNAGLYAKRDDKWYYGQKKGLKKITKNFLKKLI